MTDLNFKPVEAADMKILAPYFGLRPNKTCDSVPLDSFIWRKYYHVQYAIHENRALLWLMKEEGVMHSAMPLCKEENLKKYFDMTVEYFNNVLHIPLKIYLADEEAVEFLHLKESDDFVVTEQEDLKDYLYDGEAMRKLSGKKLHKKKNHLNAFLREYEGRYEYRTLCCSDRDDVWEFLDRWWENKVEAAEFGTQLDYEVNGIHDILKNCSQLCVRMAGVYIDGKLEAFTIGSYNEFEKMAVIHIEKANPEINGLYQFINREFLVRAFPEEMMLVNREDDVGMEGLRRAKMSYNPIDFARKYSIEQKDFKG